MEKEEETADNFDKLFLPLFILILISDHPDKICIDLQEYIPCQYR